MFSFFQWSLELLNDLWNENIRSLQCLALADAAGDGWTFCNEHPVFILIYRNYELQCFSPRQYLLFIADLIKAEIIFIVKTEKRERKFQYRIAGSIIDMNNGFC